MVKSETINVLYVDDEPHNLDSFKAAFRRDFNIFIALSAKEASLVLKKNIIHVLITDQRMPDTLGTELLADAVTKYPYQSRILLTGYTDIEAIIDALNRGQIFKYLAKPWDEALLKECIKIGYSVFLKKIMVEQDVSKYNSSDKNVYKTIKKRNPK
jgi:response regulator RpfG family c-di-GMP phosphodiesterase